MVQPCSKTDCVCSVIHACGFAIKLMESFCTTGIFSNTGSVRFCGLRGRAAFTTTGSTEKPFFYSGSHSTLAAFQVTKCISVFMHRCGVCGPCDPSWSPGHCVVCFVVGRTSRRSNDLSCTLKRLSWNVLAPWTLRCY